jgi:PD-(D/E)XK nuclease superfamily
MKYAQSYTSISTYKRCPKAWKARYIDGMRGPPKPASDRGTELHDRLEQFFRGTTPYPAGTRALAPWQKFMENLLQYSPSPECEYAVSEEWGPVPYNDPNAHMKGKADLRYIKDDVLHILDWKSGKVYPDHETQGRTYVALDCEEVRGYQTEFVYLDMPTITVIRRYNNLNRLTEINKLQNIIKVIEEDTEYVATPSYEACKYCHLSWRAGGDCTRAP